MITIVSGLPRSGTSMMMKMLETGGINVVVDNLRKADEDNPRGYYEFENVKKIKEDSSWLNAVKGKAVKMVSMLLFDLPSDIDYRIVFMKRNMDEILSSQKTMLERKGEANTTNIEELRILFKKHLHEIEKWLAEQKNIKVLYVSYNDMIENPHEHILIINNFLDNKLDTDKMIGVVDRSLYRKRSDQSNDQETSETDSPGLPEDIQEKEKIEAQLKSLGYM